MGDAALRPREPFDGPVRIVAEANFDAAFLFADEVLPWSLDWPLESVAQDRDVDYEDFKPGTLIDDPREVALLRALRASYIEQFVDPWGSGGIMGVIDEGVVYRLYIRDVLPVEDETGLAPWAQP